MEDFVNQLFTILEQEIRIYSSILKMSKNKTELIVAGKIQELDNTVKLEQALVLQIGKLERQRETVIDNIAAQLMIAKEDFNISMLSRHLQDSQQEKLKDYQKNMGNVMNDLKGANDLNGKLIKQALDYVEFSLNIMTGTSVSGSVYGQKGTTKDVKGTRNLFDMKL